MSELMVIILAMILPLILFYALGSMVETSTGGKSNKKNLLRM